MNIWTSIQAKILSAALPHFELDPCDWDHQSYCCESDGMPATHRVLTGMVGDTPVYDMVCCMHSARR